MYALNTEQQRVPLVAVALAGLAVLGLVSRLHGSLAATVVATTLVISAAAAFADARTGLIPNRLVAAAAVPGLLFLVHAGATGAATTWLDMSLGTLSAAGPILAIHVVSPSAIGFGDVKLAAVLGASLGIIDPRASLLALCVASALTGLAGLLRRRSELPFGPGLVAGSVVAMFCFTLTKGALPWR